MSKLITDINAKMISILTPLNNKHPSRYLTRSWDPSTDMSQLCDMTLTGGGKS